MLIHKLQNLFKQQTADSLAIKLLRLLLTVLVLLFGLLLASGILFNAAVVDLTN